MKLPFIFQICALGLCVFLGTSRPAEAHAMPNIVLIFVDDMGINDIGAYTYPTLNPYPASGPTPIDNTDGGANSPLSGPNEARLLTPNIDSLATNGMKFTSFYAASPVCTPSRAGLLTGCYATRLQMESVILPDNNVYGIHSQEVTLAERLKQRGYITGMVGKWHLGDSIDFRPTRHGFDQFLGLTASHDIWSQNPYLTGLGDMKLYDGESAITSALTTSTGGSITSPVDTNTEQSYLLEAFTERALSFIDTSHAANKPFFLYFASHAPHVPCIPHPDFLGSSGAGNYYDMIKEVDSRVGQILAKLAALGIDNNTIVLFSSDNGSWINRPGPTDPLQSVGSCYPYRGYKRVAQEGGAHVPLLVRYPGQIAAGSVENGLASNIDIMPTLLSLVGGEIPTDRSIDGVNLWPLMHGETTVSPRTKFFYYEQGATAAAGIRQGDWKRLSTAASGNGLFNLSTDIQETTDVAGANAAINSSLTSTLNNFNSAMVRRARGLTQSNHIEIRKSAADPSNTNTVPLIEGGTATFEVRLAAAADATVVISPFSGASNISVQSGANLTFNPANFSTWQTVTLAAAVDTNNTNDGATLRASSGSMHVREIFALETDSASPPSPNITVFTSFAGTAAALSGNTGFSSTILSGTAGGGTPSAATFTTGNLPGLPIAYLNSGLANSGNYISTGSGGGGAQPAFLTLSSAIAAESTSTTYFSYLYDVTSTAGQGGGMSFFNGATELVQIGTGGTAPNGTGTIRIAPPSTVGQVNSSAGSYVSGAGNTAWIIGKITTASGVDTVSINIYQGSRTAPLTEGTWDLAYAATLPSDITTIRFNSPNVQQFDEFRMGTTYAAVSAAVTPAAPVITPNQSATGSHGSPFSYQLLASGSPTSWALVSGNLPAGITLNTGTGQLSGTSMAIATYSLTFTATNAIGTSPAASVTVFISPAVASIVSESFNYAIFTKYN